MHSIIHALEVFFSDCEQITRSTYHPARKRQIFFAYLKLYFFQYTLSKFVKIRDVSFLGYTIETFNYYNLFFLFREIFVKGAYYTREHVEGVILDCGANIGMATLFFHWLWPNARIECYEPDRQTFELLTRNIHTNQIPHVTLHNVALSVQNGEIEFVTPQDNPGCLKMSTTDGRVQGVRCLVPCIDFSQECNKPIAILKMDIEGAEYPVMKRLEKTERLKNVKRIFVEYHHNISHGDQRSFSKFLDIFEGEGFRFQVNAHFDPWDTNSNPYQDIIVRCERM